MIMKGSENLSKIYYISADSSRQIVNRSLDIHLFHFHSMCDKRNALLPMMNDFEIHHL